MRMKRTMDRLTGRNDKGDLLFCKRQVYAGDLYEAASALEEYEDTGLTPEQIREIDELYSELARELMRYKQAEEQGTLIRVPTTKGNIIWEIIDDGVVGAYIQGIEVQEVSDCRIWANDACYDYDDIDRTIFLTREKVKIKLAEMEAQK